MLSVQKLGRKKAHRAMH